MNENHIQQIFANYIEQFEQMNNTSHREYYKWKIINRFHDEMDNALNVPAVEFPKKLYELKKLSFNLIDNYTQPFYGLVKYAEKEPETVRGMFQDLYADGDLHKRVQKFLAKSHALRENYYPNSYLYKDDMHSATGYLFLYDPDHNYIFKSTHAQIFADCVEFYDDWGYGDNIKLDVYYRMCDELVGHIRSSKELLMTDASRFENGWGEDTSTFYSDPEKHILAFDLIYCCSTYGLFKGITFARPKSKERQLMKERKNKAVELSNNLEEARAKVQELENAREYVNSVFVPGVTIHHKSFGDGTIRENKGTNIVVGFPTVGEKQLGTFVSAANGIIKVDADNYMERIDGYRDVLKKENSIRTAYSYAEKQFAPYAEYLD